MDRVYVIDGKMHKADRAILETDGSITLEIDKGKYSVTTWNTFEVLELE